MNVCLCVFRVLLDRAYSDWDAMYYGLGLGSSSPSFTHQPVNMDTSHTIVPTSASGPPTSCSSTYSSDLLQILHNIKACRWRHFRPWMALTHDPNNLRSCSAQKLSFGLFTPARNRANNRPADPPPTRGVYLQD